MEEKVELLCRTLWPYVQEIVSQVLNEKADLSEATAESLAELVCFRVERTVRKMVRSLNENAQKGAFEELQKLIREDPELARKASRYVATRFKRRIRRLLLSELSRRNNSPNGARSQLKSTQNQPCRGYSSECDGLKVAGNERRTHRKHY